MSIITTHPLLVYRVETVERHQDAQVNINKINYEDLKRWGIEGAIKRELILDKLIENEATPDLSEEELIQNLLKSESIYTQEELAKWMRNENMDKASLLIRAVRHSKWIKICEKKYKNQDKKDLFHQLNV